MSAHGGENDDAVRRQPFLSGVCADRATIRPRHDLCGGWWCVCDCHDDSEADRLEQLDYASLVDVQWRQVGRAVFADDRLIYHGKMPDTREGREQTLRTLDLVSKRAQADWLEARAAVRAWKAERDKL